MRLIDTHCHIDLDAFDEDRADVIERAVAAGVTEMLVIGFEPERWRAAMQLAAQYPLVRVAAGLHPNSSSRFSEQLVDEIASVATATEVIAIGETGIDLYWDAAPLDQQKQAFHAQVSLAIELGLPFIVHQRDAEVEVLDVLREFDRPLTGVLHCFTGDWQYAQEILELGMDIGLGGAITFKSRIALHEAARLIPLERIVLETDAPFMAPVPFRGKRNEPAYIGTVARRLSELRDVSLETVASATVQNAIRIFPGIAG